MAKRKHIEPIPGKFSSYEKAGDFWDRRDTTDYPEAFSEVGSIVDLKGRKFEIDIDADVMEMLRQRARNPALALGLWQAVCFAKNSQQSELDGRTSGSRGNMD